MRYGSLFSGIGGIDLGLDRAGMSCSWQVEVDPICTTILERHWPDVERFGDIKQLDTGWLSEVDLICGGFPCQPVSEAAYGVYSNGQHRGTLGHHDERWLWPEFARIVCDLRPRYVLVENVVGLRSKGLAAVCGQLSEYGYDCEWTSVPAHAVGAPHNRWRVYVVAYPHGTVATLRGQRAGISPDGDGGPVDGAGSSSHAERQIPVLEAGEDPGDAGVTPRIFVRPPTLSSWPHRSAPVGVVDGVSGGLDRLKTLGNSVVPQVAEWIGRLILEHERGPHVHS